MRALNERPDLWPYIAASLVAHALLILLAPFATTIPKFKEDTVEVFPIFLRDDGKYQIADIARPSVEKRPDKAKFLGLYDSSVEKESVASGLHRPGRGEKAGEKGTPRLKPTRQKKDLFAFSPNLFKDKDKFKEGNASEEGGSRAEDFYPDFSRGPHTYLNVLRYPGVEYFVRMKRAFKITFNPVPALRSHFASNIISRGSVDVVLGVSVGTTGELVELFVFRDSGIPSYDEEAMRTVRASAPFSKPPEKFLDDDGLLRMSWTFSVYL